MNVAYKHLDAKLRVAQLTVGQWLGVCAGVALAVLWGIYVSPFGLYVTLVSSIYLGALPAGATFLASVTEFDVWLLMRSGVSWRRREGRFLPGSGDEARGYVVRDDPQETRAELARRRAADLDLAALWEHS